jgi:hypothetical protein
MLLANLFNYSIPVVFCVLLWLCHRYRKPFIGWWGVAALAFGIVGDFIPWRTWTGFHYGTGTPIPWIIWERNDHQGGRYDDFPNPFGVVENPVFIFLIGLIVWSFYIGVRALVRRARHIHDDKPQVASLSG